MFNRKLKNKIKVLENNLEREIDRLKEEIDYLNTLLSSFINKKQIITMGKLSSLKWKKEKHDCRYIKYIAKYKGDKLISAYWGRQYIFFINDFDNIYFKDDKAEKIFKLIERKYIYDKLGKSDSFAVKDKFKFKILV